MYLLKPNFPPGIIFGFLYLHSTMYLLKHIPAVIISREWFNLHSTMYLLKPFFLKAITFFIYNLHSTMYLLKPYAYLIGKW